MLSPGRPPSTFFTFKNLPKSITGANKGPVPVPAASNLPFADTTGDGFDSSDILPINPMACGSSHVPVSVPKLAEWQCALQGSAIGGDSGGGSSKAACPSSLTVRVTKSCHKPPSVTPVVRKQPNNLWHLATHADSAPSLVCAVHASSWQVNHLTVVA